MKDILKLVISLGIVCMVGSAALAWVNKVTAEPRRVAKEKALNESLKLILPADTAKTEPIPWDGDVNFFRALDKDGKVLAFAAQGVGKGGFGGDIKVVAGIGKDGKLLGVMVTEHQETPGVGTKATDRKAAKSLWDVLTGKAKEVPFPPNQFLDAFTGRAATGFAMDAGENAVQGISGATYSSKAVLSGVNSICEAFKTLDKSAK